MSEYDEAVADGMALLESVVPGCLDKIDLSTLHAGDWFRCPAAQAVGDGNYDRARDRLNINTVEDAARFGFALDSPEVDALMNQGAYEAARDLYAPLTEAWVKALSARRSAEQTST